MSVRVAIIEDDVATLSLLVLVLGLISGVEVVSKHSAVLPGLASVFELRPDVVVLDLSMPNVGGKDAIDTLAATGAEVVVFSALLADDSPTLAGVAAQFAKTARGQGDLSAWFRARALKEDTT